MDNQLNKFIKNLNPYEFIPIPDYEPTYEEITIQMRINADIIKKEISDHIDKEIERFKRETQK